jgi:hypothetical protein
VDPRITVRLAMQGAVTDGQAHFEEKHPQQDHGTNEPIAPYGASGYQLLLGISATGHI